MSHYALTEEQQYEIHNARLLCQLVIDLSSNNPKKQVEVDVEALAVLCSAIQSKLPTEQSLDWHTS
ncbi:MAG: hypothetical protein PHR16_11885 [Methylovulum sp.]|nr:hypothetical protein [Methylovulum sp.]